MAIRTLSEFTTAHDSVQAAIAGIIEQTANTDLSLNAEVYNRFAYSEQSEWLAMLTNSADKIHSWMVGFGGGQINSPNSRSTNELPLILNFEIRGFFGYEFGTSNANSEQTFRNLCASLQWNFWKAKRLNLDSTVLRHFGLSYTVSPLARIGGQFGHLANARLQVELHEVY